MDPPAVHKRSMTNVDDLSVSPRSRTVGGSAWFLGTGAEEESGRLFCRAGPSHRRIRRRDAAVECETEIRMRAQYVRLWRRVVLACVGAVSVALAFLLQFTDFGISDLRAASTVELFGLFGLIVFPAMTMIVLRMDREARQRQRRLQAN